MLVGLLAAVTVAGCQRPLPRVLAGPPATYRVTLTDPTGDDHGPGSYVYPRGAAFPDGTFDLTQVHIAERGQDLEVTVQIRGEFREWDFALSPAVRARAVPQVIDVYIDQDGVPGSGLTRALPGRGIAIAKQSAWEKVLVVTSPSVAQLAIASGQDRRIERRAIPPVDVRLAGNRLVARFPIKQTGRPQPHWGYTVAMFGTSYVPTPELGRRFGKNDFGLGHVRDVRRVAGVCSSVDDPATSGCSFGGCAPCGGHPRAIDVIVPAGREQRTILSSYEPGKPAVLPAVYPLGRAAAGAEAKGGRLVSSR